LCVVIEGGSWVAARCGAPAIVISVGPNIQRPPGHAPLGLGTEAAVEPGFGALPRTTTQR
jgi:hypothetical protein